MRRLAWDKSASRPRRPLCVLDDRFGSQPRSTGWSAPRRSSKLPLLYLMESCNGPYEQSAMVEISDGYLFKMMVFTLWQNRVFLSSWDWLSSRERRSTRWIPRRHSASHKLTQCDQALPVEHAIGQARNFRHPDSQEDHCRRTTACSFSRTAP